MTLLVTLKIEARKVFVRIVIHQALSLVLSNLHTNFLDTVKPRRWLHEENMLLTLTVLSKIEILNTKSDIISLRF